MGTDEEAQAAIDKLNGAMRQVLVDHARRRAASKREDAWNQVTLTDPTASRAVAINGEKPPARTEPIW